MPLTKKQYAARGRAWREAAGHLSLFRTRNVVGDALQCGEIMGLCMYYATTCETMAKPKRKR